MRTTTFRQLITTGTNDLKYRISILVWKQGRKEQLLLRRPLQAEDPGLALQLRQKIFGLRYARETAGTLRKRFRTGMGILCPLQRI